MRRFIAAIMIVALLSTSNALAQARKPEETKAQRDARMKWWREGRFGLFIHWGLYAIPGGEWNGKKLPRGQVGEWIMNSAQIPVADYEKLAGQFNPTKFDAEQWVQLAKNAGMKYIVLTSKHHDGFCLWDSKVSTYDVMDASPFKRDIIKELAEACRRHGVVLCFYHSIMDWHHPDAQAPHYPTYNTDSKSNPNFRRYVDSYLKPQVKELLTNYGPIGVMWFDGEWIPEWTEEMGKEMEAYCRSLQPQTIVNNRVGKGRQGMAGMSKDQSFAGDFGTPEQEIPATGFPGVDWESCMTMNDTWGYRSDDNRWKSERVLIRNLIDTASKGGNYLLNVGPTPEGEIPAPSVERLNAIGKWMKTNSEAIYATEASPFKKLSFGKATRKEGKIYLHVFEWPKDSNLQAPLANRIRKAYLMTAPTDELIVKPSEQGATITVPGDMPDPHATVIALEIEGEPRALSTTRTIQPGADGNLILLAIDAEIEGSTARVEKKGSNPHNIGYWTHAQDKAVWQVQGLQPGKYRVTVEYSLDKGSSGSEYAIEVGKAQVHVRPEVTGSWMDFRKVEVGEIEVKESGPLQLIVRPIKKPGQAVLDLRSITLMKL